MAKITEVRFDESIPHRLNEPIRQLLSSGCPPNIIFLSPSQSLVQGCYAIVVTASIPPDPLTCEVCRSQSTSYRVHDLHIFKSFVPSHALDAGLLVLSRESQPRTSGRILYFPFDYITSSRSSQAVLGKWLAELWNVFVIDDPTEWKIERNRRFQILMDAMQFEMAQFLAKQQSLIEKSGGTTVGLPSIVSGTPSYSPSTSYQAPVAPTPKPPPVLGIVFHQASQPEASKAQLWCDQLRAMSPASYKTQIRLFTEAEAVAAKPMAVVVMVLTASVRYSATSSLKELIGELKKVTEVVEVVALYQNATTGPIVGWNTTNHGEPDTLIDFTPMNWYCSMDNGFVGSSDKQQAALSKVRSDWLRLLESIERR